LLARAELKDTPREGTIYSLLAFSVLGSLLLAGSGDIMFIVLGLLISSLSGFALSAYPKTDAATEGALKYFVYGSVAGAIMIFGLTYWVGVTGSTLLSSLRHLSNSPFILIIGFVSLLAGFGYAASIFPFHFWTPDTFEGSPVSIAAHLSVVPKIGALFGLAQVMKELPATVNISFIVAIVAVLSMTYGNVVALWQKNVVRILAYSTIAQAGYFLIAIAVFKNGKLATPALVIFALAYAAMNIGAFAIVQWAGKTLEDFKGLAKNHPITTIDMTIFLFSLVGVPPLAGFAGKFLLFGAAIDNGYAWLAIAAIVNSAISLAVYLQIIMPMYFRDAEDEKKKAKISIVWKISVLITVAVGIGVQWLLGLIIK
jgi:proton-translocating NADH-quinone oxidoreductase chain N